MTYPTTMPAITLDFQNSQQLDPRVKFSRSSVGSYTNSSGQIAYAAADEPRFEYDNEGKCLGLLVESARNNSIQYSEDFSATTGYWSNPSPSVTFTTGQESPDGNNTGTLFTGEGNVQRANAKTNNSGRTNPAFFTVFAKLTDTVETNIRLELSSSSGDSYRIIFNLSTGTVVSNDGSSADVNKALITPYANGWYRCQVMGDIQNTASIGVFIKNYADAIFWGAQLELTNRESWPSSYIPNTGNSNGKNRAAEVINANFSHNSSFDGRSGTLVVKSLPIGGNQYASPVTLGWPGSSRPTVSGNSGTSLDGYLNAKIVGNAGGVTKANGRYVPDIRCIAFTPGDNAYAINNSVAQTNNNSNWTNNIAKSVKLYQTTGNFSGITANYLMRVMVYPERVSNETVQLLTL